MNRVVLVGRLENTPELRHTSTGIPVANFSLSVRRSIPNGQGRYERDVFRVVTWRKLAETCCRFLERGRMIAVDGKLQNRVMASGSDKRVIVEIHADDVRFLEGARPRNGEEDELGDANHFDADIHDTIEVLDDSPLDEPELQVEHAAVKENRPTHQSGNGEHTVAKFEESSNEWLNDEDAGTPLDLNS